MPLETFWPTDTADEFYVAGDYTRFIVVQRIPG